MPDTSATSATSAGRFRTARVLLQISRETDRRGTAIATSDGSHDELLAANGRYANLFQLQATRYHANGGPDA